LGLYFRKTFNALTIHICVPADGQDLVLQSSGDDSVQISRCILKPVHNVAEKCDCRRIRRRSPLSRRFLRQSHFSATLWTGF